MSGELVFALGPSCSFCKQSRQALAASASGWATLLSPAAAAAAESSKPITAVPAPGARPRAVSKDQAPSAIRSLTHTNASGGLDDSSS